MTTVEFFQMTQESTEHTVNYKNQSKMGKIKQYNVGNSFLKMKDDAHCKILLVVCGRQLILKYFIGAIIYLQKRKRGGGNSRHFCVCHFYFKNVICSESCMANKTKENH